MRRHRIAAAAIAGALAAAAAGLAGGIARAGPVEDGNAGLEALDRGDYDGAVRLFTRTLAAPGLTPDDRELAYVNRGKAYLGKKAYRLALADFREAKRLKPDDEEAGDGLRLAQAGGRGAPAVARAPSEAQLKARWGMTANLADHVWLLSGKAPQLYVRYQWQVPGRVMTFDGSDHKGRPIAGQCELPEGGGAIACATTYLGATSSSTVALQGDGWEESIAGEGFEIKQIFRAAGPGAFSLVNQTFRNGAWTTGPTLTLASVPEERIAALKWKPHQPSKFGRFLGELGKSLLAATLSAASGTDGSDQGDPNAQPPQ